MQLTELRQQNFHVVLLFDPITVNTISVDSVKASTIFHTFALFSDAATGGVLALESGKLKVTIQSNRLEYIDENEGVFTSRKLDELWNLLRVLPKFSIKAYGINLFSRLIPQVGETAGKFVATNYINNHSVLETKLGLPLLSASVRLFLGTPDNHRDLRLTPLDFSSKELALQYHFHRDTPIADIDKLKHTVEDSFFRSCKECENWYQQLP
jgi:hypothetical protein